MVDLKLSGDDVNRIVADAVLQSTVGETLRTIIKKYIEDLSKTYNNPFEQEIKNLISIQMKKTIEDEFAGQIREKAGEQVRRALTDDVLESLIAKAVARAQDALTNRY